MEDNGREINQDKTSVFPTKRVRTLCLHVFWGFRLCNMKSLESNNSLAAKPPHRRQMVELNCGERAVRMLTLLAKPRAM